MWFRRVVMTKLLHPSSSPPSPSSSSSSPAVGATTRTRARPGARSSPSGDVRDILMTNPNSGPFGQSMDTTQPIDTAQPKVTAQMRRLSGSDRGTMMSMMSVNGDATRQPLPPLSLQTKHDTNSYPSSNFSPWPSPIPSTSPSRCPSPGIDAVGAPAVDPTPTSDTKTKENTSSNNDNTSERCAGVRGRSRSRSMGHGGSVMDMGLPGGVPSFEAFLQHLPSFTTSIATTTTIPIVAIPIITEPTATTSSAIASSAAITAPIAITSPIAIASIATPALLAPNRHDPSSLTTQIPVLPSQMMAAARSQNRAPRPLPTDSDIFAQYMTSAFINNLVRTFFHYQPRI